MKFEGVAQGKVRRPAIELGAVIENTCFRHVVAVTSRKRSSSVGAAGATATSRIGHNRRYSTKAVGREAVVTAQRTRTKIGIERVVVLGYVGVTASQCKASAHALLEGQNPAVVFSRIPGAEAIHKGNCGVVFDARSKRQIRLPNTENILNILVVVVYADDPIVGELALNAESVAAAVRRGEAGIDGDGEIAGLDDQKGQRAERSPEPEIGWRACGCVGGSQVSIGR